MLCCWMSLWLITKEFENKHNEVMWPKNFPSGSKLTRRTTVSASSRRTHTSTRYFPNTRQEFCQFSASFRMVPLNRGLWMMWSCRDTCQGSVGVFAYKTTKNATQISVRTEFRTRNLQGIKHVSQTLKCDILQGHKNNRSDLYVTFSYLM